MVSVVVPTYNSERFIAETLQAVTAQTLTPAEIIIVDGGSTDATLEIASGFEVTISPERSHNIPSGRNIGMRMASSEWVALVDHDDLWEPSKLERQVGAIERFPDVRMVLTDYVAFSDQETTGSKMAMSDERYRALGGQQGGYFPRIDFTDQDWIVPLTSSCLIKRGTTFFDEDLQGTDDIEFFLRMMTYPFVLIDAPLVRWRMTSDSFSHKEPLSMKLDFVNTMNKIMQNPSRYPDGIPACVERIRRQRMRRVSIDLLRGGKPGAAISMFGRSFGSPGDGRKIE